ncbi:MAG TPA: nuclear transport factor 2 family protein [Rhizomicrobium sp.]|jgi:ketosteroid isomerase-like protein
MTGGKLETNRRLLERILKAYGEGDLERVVSWIDDNVTWMVHTLPGHYRFGGPRRGHLGMSEVWAMIATYFTMERYDSREIVGEGDVLWSTNELTVLVRKSGKRVMLRLVNRWEFRDGKVIFCDEYFDTAGALAQQDRIPEEVPDEGGTRE